MGLGEAEGDQHHIQYKQQTAKPDPRVNVKVLRACHDAGCYRRRTQGHTGTAVATTVATQRYPSP